MGAPMWTSGQWQASGIRFNAIIDGRQVKLLAVVRAADSGGIAYIPYSDRTPKAHVESHADQRLIAAAPDMAEACRMLVESHDADMGTYALGKLYEAREAARAALSKARGETR